MYINVQIEVFNSPFIIEGSHDKDKHVYLAKQKLYLQWSKDIILTETDNDYINNTGS
jgi:hypothetical protein